LNQALTTLMPEPPAADLFDLQRLFGEDHGVIEHGLIAVMISMFRSVKPGPH
jgi:hypothetical protein